jgi:hypothetical protein
VSDRAGRAIYVGKLKAGREVDFKLFKEELSGLKYNGRAVWVDLGFLGIRHWLSDANIFILHKKPKGKTLTNEQKKENTAMARIRVKVEHVIAGIKRYFILQQRSRFKVMQKLDDALHLCAGLWNLTRGFTVNIA